MKRIIKFRAWHKKASKMYEVTEMFFTDKARVGKLKGRGENRTLYDEDIELMQFTGLFDKNGKEIYEGDILKVTNHEGKETILEMKFDNHHIGDFFNWQIHGFRDYSKSTYGHEVEVIGNIFESPELL